MRLALFPFIRLVAPDVKRACELEREYEYRYPDGRVHSRAMGLNACLFRLAQLRSRIVTKGTGTANPVSIFVRATDEEVKMTYDGATGSFKLADEPDARWFSPQQLKGQP